MKSLVKASTGVAVLLLAAGCASKTTTAGSVSDQSAPKGGATGSSAPSAPGDSPTSTPSVPNGVDPGKLVPSLSPVPTRTDSPAPGKNTAPPGTSPTGVPDQVKYISPEAVGVSTDGWTLVTPVQWGGCTDQPELVVTTQDSAKVVVEVKTVSHYRMGIMCPNIARNGEASVKLAAPLGSRQVVDALTHKVIPTH